MELSDTNFAPTALPAVLHVAALPDFSNAAMAYMAHALAGQVACILKNELARVESSTIQPMLLDVKQAAVYIGRSEQSVQHLIASRVLPVVRHGRRVHLHRPDLDAWIEQNKF
jgi:excisionase family DNA binding protein